MPLSGTQTFTLFMGKGNAMKARGHVCYSWKQGLRDEEKQCKVYILMPNYNKVLLRYYGMITEGKTIIYIQKFKYYGFTMVQRI